MTQLPPPPSRLEAVIGWRTTVTQGAGLTAMLLLALPAPSQADDRPEHVQGWTARPALERALTGGVRWLLAPRAGRVLIAGAAFEMGSSPEQVLAAAADCRREPLGERCTAEMFANERPQQPVSVGPYFLDRTEVTVEQYRRCVRVGACATPSGLPADGRFDDPSYPVSRVKWSDARDYCSWTGARLPTEAEWELGARGAEGRRYPWGELYHSRAANHGRFGVIRTDPSDGYAELAPVGSLPAGRTPSGLLDMAGNVSEWVADNYAEGSTRASARASGPTKRSRRVVRGGDYMSGAPWLRGAARGGLPASTRWPQVGFRCARSLGK